jgi:class 3 adenylate cyclase
MENREAYEKTAIMFVDVAGSTKLYEKEGDEKAQKIIESCLRIVSDTVKDCNGTIIKYVGDEAMCRFDNEDTAVGAAIRIQQTLEQRSGSELLPSVRIGLHYGMAIEKFGDVFGDAVNLAARVASIAKGKQIITTQETVQNLSPEHIGMTREFDKTPIKGKEGETTIYEVLWQPEGATRMRTRLTNGAEGATLLSIVYAGNEHNIRANAPDFLIGRDSRCDLVVNSDYSSRVHAHIEYRRGKFVLVDESTNGTYVAMDKKKVYLRREELPLVGSGTIGLGDAASEENNHLIRYVCL